MKKILIKLLLVILIFTGIIFTVNIIMSSPVDKGNNKEISLVIKEGATTSQIANDLENKELIRSAFFFKLKSKLLGYDGKYFTGSFKLKKSMSIDELMKSLTSSTPGIAIKIPEGTSTEKIASILESKGIISSEDFLNEVENGNFDYDFLNDEIKGRKRLEGFLYPDTYNFHKGEKASVIVNAMLKNFEKNLDKDYKALSKKRKKSFYEVLIIASIIEKEGVSNEDKFKISSVIYNRLDINMLLQMDSTVAYVLKTDKIRLTLDDIKYDSPYNTYLYKGLPPTPIASPSKASILAALKPANTKYLYFVAGEKLNGETNFSETYEKFLEDKEKFDKGYEKYIKENPGKV